jgi:hypothetical protein
MAEKDFGATGPTNVAFETLSTNIPVDQEFGVSVVGSRCGVYGQATTHGQKDRQGAPSGTGVFGRGESFGVYGISYNIPEDNTPKPFLSSSSGEPNVSIGVVGVSDRGLSDAPAVFGDNFVLEKDIRGPVRSVFDEAVNLPVGVEGVSWHGHGVFGISLNLSLAKSSPPVDARLGGVKQTAGGNITDPIGPSLNTTTSPAGVLGLSIQGAGVRGVSRSDRGGIFQSATARSADDQPVVAQVRLVPHGVDLLPGEVDPPLPKDGHTGDLLAIVYSDPNGRRANLWFCEVGGNSTSPARWRKVALTDEVAGTK